MRASEVRTKLVEEKLRVVPAEKLLYHLLSLTTAPLDVDRFENGDDVFQKKLGIICPPPGQCVVGMLRRRQELKDLQLASDPGSRPRRQVRPFFKELG